MTEVSPNDVQIRAAILTDAPVIYDFLCTLEDTNLNQPAFYSVYKQNLTNPFIHYLVAEFNGEVIGFVSCHVQALLHHCGNVGEIQELFVQPIFRNQRIGQKLVAELKSIAVRENFVNLEVTTNQKRIDTIRFYERESFKRSHVKLVNPIQH